MDQSTIRAGAQTERAIVDAATALFYEKGYHATSMREIASAVGIKAGSLYNHFPSKHDMLYRIALGSITELLESGSRVLEQHESADQRLAAWVHNHVVYHAEYRFRAKVADDQLHALEPESLVEVIGVRDAYEATLKTILQQGREELGWVVPDISVITFAVATMCTAVGVWYREGGRLEPDDIAALYADFVFSAVKARKPKRARATQGGSS